MGKIKQTLTVLNGKKLPISIIVAGTIAVATLQAQVTNHSNEIEKLRPTTTQVARVEDQIKGLEKNFVDFRDEQRKVNIRQEDKLDAIIRAVVK